MFRYIDKEILKKIASYGIKTKWGEIFNSDKPRWKMIAKEKLLVEQGYPPVAINMYMELGPLLSENEAISKYNKDLDIEQKEFAEVQVVNSLEYAMSLAAGEHFMSEDDFDSLRSLLSYDEFMWHIWSKFDVAFAVNKLMDEKYCVYRDRIISGLSKVFIPSVDEYEDEGKNIQSLWAATCHRVCKVGLDLSQTNEKDPVIKALNDYCNKFLEMCPIHEIQLLWLFSYSTKCEQENGGLDEIPTARSYLQQNIKDRLMQDIEEIIQYNYVDDDYSYWDEANKDEENN